MVLGQSVYGRKLFMKLIRFMTEDRIEQLQIDPVVRFIKRQGLKGRRTEYLHYGAELCYGTEQSYVTLWSRVHYITEQSHIEAQEGSPRQVTRSLFFKAPGHQVTFFHEKIKTTQVTGRFFKLSRSCGRPQNGPRSQVAKNPSWASTLPV